MELSVIDRRLLTTLAEGLPLVPEPYRALGEALGVQESDVLSRLAALTRAGVIKRFGVVVRHHEIGYRANAMVVWDVPDAQVKAVGQGMAAVPYVTLCYRRPRRLPEWPYNLFCMIHGRDRGTVLRQVDELIERLGLADVPRALLFSNRRFKQQGAHYFPEQPVAQPASEIEALL